jgi:hypothetical protein
MHMSDDQSRPDERETRAIATALFYDALMGRWFVITQQDWPVAEEPEPVEVVWGCLVDTVAGNHAFQYLDYRELLAWKRVEDVTPCLAGPLVKLLRQRPQGGAVVH